MQAFKQHHRSERRTERRAPVPRCVNPLSPSEVLKVFLLHCFQHLAINLLLLFILKVEFLKKNGKRSDFSDSLNKQSWMTDLVGKKAIFEPDSVMVPFHHHKQFLLHNSREFLSFCISVPFCFVSPWIEYQFFIWSEDISLMKFKWRQNQIVPERSGLNWMVAVGPLHLSGLAAYEPNPCQFCKWYKPEE